MFFEVRALFVLSFLQLFFDVLLLENAVLLVSISLEQDLLLSFLLLDHFHGAVAQLVFEVLTRDRSVQSIQAVLRHYKHTSERCFVLDHHRVVTFSSRVNEASGLLVELLWLLWRCHEEGAVPTSYDCLLG